MKQNHAPFVAARLVSLTIMAMGIAWFAATRARLDPVLFCRLINWQKRSKYGIHGYEMVY